MRLDHDSILAQTFKKSLSGYSKEEVHDFLKIVAKDFKEMKRDLARLREELNVKDRQVRELDEELISSRNKPPIAFRLSCTSSSSPVRSSEAPGKRTRTSSQACVICLPAASALFTPASSSAGTV